MELDMFLCMFCTLREECISMYVEKAQRILENMIMMLFVYMEYLSALLGGSYKCNYIHWL